MKTQLLFACVFALSSASASSEIYWHDESLTLNWGTGFEVDPDEQVTLTFESAGGASWGDWFIFYDGTDFLNSDSDGYALYGEISPRLSFNKLFDAGIKWGAMTDMSLALTYESGKGDVESLLYGVGLDWEIPYVTYLQTNLYYRNGTNNNSDGWQLSPVFRFDIPIGDSNIVVDGFIDWVFEASEPGYSTNIHFNPQIKYDLGMAMNGEGGANKLFVGLKYDYWKNKYGIEDSPSFNTDQSAISALIKYHF